MISSDFCTPSNWDLPPMAVTHKFLVLTDYLNSLQQMHSLYSVHPLVCGVHQSLTLISIQGMTVVFIWVLGHLVLPVMNRPMFIHYLMILLLLNTFCYNLAILSELFINTIDM